MGDSFQEGIYDGKKLSKKDVIIVTHNYRLNIFGFGGHTYLQDETSSKTTGNYGLQDQREALKWIKANAKVFGGDPNRITIFGESAGGISVCSHLGSPNSKGLFAHAIMSSGSCDSPSAFSSLDNVVDWTSNFMRTVGCDDQTMNKQQFLNCIRALSPDQLMTPLDVSRTPVPYSEFNHPLMYPLFGWFPTIDGSEAGLPKLPLDMIKSGTWADVPVIAGSNFNEGGLLVAWTPTFVPGMKLPITDESQTLMFLNYMWNNNETLNNEVLKAYPLSDFNNTVRLQLDKIFTDMFFGCGTEEMIKAVSNQGQNAYRYYFNHDVLGSMNKTVHATDLFFTWGNFLEFKLLNHGEKISEYFQDGWTNFAKTGNPNGKAGNIGGTVWTPWSEEAKAFGIKYPTVMVSEAVMNQRCSLWDNAIKYFPYNN